MAESESLESLQAEAAISSFTQRDVIVCAAKVSMGGYEGLVYATETGNVIFLDHRLSPQAPPITLGFAAASLSVSGDLALPGWLVVALTRDSEIRIFDASGQQRYRLHLPATPLSLLQIKGFLGLLDVCGTVRALAMSENNECNIEVSSALIGAPVTYFSVFEDTNIGRGLAIVRQRSSVDFIFLDKEKELESKWVRHFPEGVSSVFLCPDSSILCLLVDSSAAIYSPSSTDTSQANSIELPPYLRGEPEQFSPESVEKQREDYQQFQKELYRTRIAALEARTIKPVEREAFALRISAIAAEKSARVSGNLASLDPTIRDRTLVCLSFDPRVFRCERTVLEFFALLPAAPVFFEFDLEILDFADRTELSVSIFDGPTHALLALQKTPLFLPQA